MNHPSFSQRITHTHAHPHDAPQSLRPQTLDHFVGQPAAIRNLKVFLQAAQHHGRPLDHMLLSGPPGLGKTTLASLIAKEKNSQFRTASGPSLTRVGDLAAIMTSLQSGDVLFIDEIHRMPMAVEEMLYSAMEDFFIDVIFGEGAHAKSVRLSLAPFTLIGATTRTGLLSAPLRDRFGILLPLTLYDHGSLVQLLHQTAPQLSVTLDPDAALHLARCARGTPRIALRLLKRVADFATVQHHRHISESFVQQSLHHLGISPDGLDGLDRHYLHYLARNHTTGPVGIDTLAAALNQNRHTLEDTVEPYLIQENWIQRTPRGRILTAEGLARLQTTPPYI